MSIHDSAVQLLLRGGGRRNEFEGSDSTVNIQTVSVIVATITSQGCEAHNSPW